MFTKTPLPQGRGVFLCIFAPDALPCPTQNRNGSAEQIFRGAVFFVFYAAGCVPDDDAGVGSGVDSGGLMTTRSFAI